GEHRSTRRHTRAHWCAGRPVDDGRYRAWGRDIAAGHSDHRPVGTALVWHLSGILGLPVLLATALAPWAGAVLAEVAGGYAAAFTILAVLAGLGTVLMIAS